MRIVISLAALCLVGVAASQTTAKPSGTVARKTYASDILQKGKALFRQDCSFCHGRDAGGGESGPDLTRSKLVASDVNGEKIGAVIRNGRPDKGMPRFEHSDAEIASLVAFIHNRQQELQDTSGQRGSGGRKGVDPSDLQTGNVEAGKKYFEGAGGCSNCHSPTGDLAGIASRLQGLQLEEHMLYPRRAKRKVEVTLSSGETLSGKLAYLDEFTIGIVDTTGTYHSWRTKDVHYKVDPSLEAHVQLFDKYTDDDVHNLMAYLQTMR
jgi:cytochrome c oxidase cbb3-type subunit 3